MRIDAPRGMLVPGKLWWGVCAISLALLANGCQKADPGAGKDASGKFEVADDQAAPASGTKRLAADPTAGGQAMAGDASPGSSPQQPPALPVNELDKLATITIPDGTPEELLAFINRLGQTAMAAQMQAGPEGFSPLSLKPVLEAMVEAADRVLAASDDTKTRKTAIDYKAGALVTLSQIDSSKPWADEVRAFATSLAAERDPVVAIEGKCILFGVLLGEVHQGRSPDVATLMTQLRSLLAEEARSGSVLSVAQQAVMALRQLGREDEAREAFELIAAAFEDHADPELAAESANMREQLAFMDARFESQLDDVVRGSEGAADTFLRTISELLGRPQPQLVALDKSLRAVDRLEQASMYPLAIQVCQLVRNAYSQHPDEDLREAADQITQAALRRLGLVGERLVLQGTTLERTPLDASQYAGKVLLVVFWESSPAAFQELRSVKSLYETYHEQGFEVVGICLDTDPTITPQFLEQAQLPWPTITNPELVEQWGVEVPPLMFLVDRAGVVVDVRVPRGALEARLKALLDASADPAVGGSPSRP